MGGVQIVSTIIAAAVTVAAVYFVVRAVRQMFAVVRQGQPDPTRSNDRGKRTVTMLRETLRHTRMLKWTVVGAAHWFVMIGFILLSSLCWAPTSRWSTRSPGYPCLTAGWSSASSPMGRHPGHPRDPGPDRDPAAQPAYQAPVVALCRVDRVAGLLRRIRDPGRSGAGLHHPRAKGRGRPFRLSGVGNPGFARARRDHPGECECHHDRRPAEDPGLMAWAITIGLNVTMGVAWHRFLAFPTFSSSATPTGRPHSARSSR